ncbi:MAG: LuxR C-terminal-related transcriptional regulator [Pseudomonadota bacterium]
MQSNGTIDDFSRTMEQIDCAVSVDQVATALAGQSGAYRVALGAIGPPILPDRVAVQTGTPPLVSYVDRRLQADQSSGTRLVLADDAQNHEDDGIRVALAELGCRSCILIGHDEAPTVSGLVAIAARDAFLSTRAMAELRALAQFALTRVFALRRKAIADAVALSKREAVCLAWVAHGKSDWEIGQILDISPKTANFHVENAKRRLGVSSRTQAVLHAAFSGGIDLKP